MNNQKGFALLFITITILSISFVIAGGLSYLTINSFHDSQNKIKSTQSYYASESGIEDYLYRLQQGMQAPDTNTLTVGGSSVEIEISELIGGSRTIISQGDTDNRIRKLSAVYLITTDDVSFFYGAQAGEGGIDMNHSGDQIIGNVFSNGNIIGNGGTITETVIVAIDGNRIEDIEIGGNAYIHSCKDSNITGDLHYVAGGTIDNCAYASSSATSSIERLDLPIPPEQITEWKDEAAAGGTISGDYILGNNETASLGPIKITGDMILNNGSILNITGIINVEGDTTLLNGSTLKLDDGFGTLSGIMVNNGKIYIKNGSALQGSGVSGSYLMLLSTNNSLDPDAPAIDVENNAEAAIFYASNGLVVLGSGVEVREVNAYKLELNKAVISYETGLENINFISGPGGGWEVKSWQEIE